MILSQFENTSQFQPWLLSKHALREIAADLLKRAGDAEPMGTVSEIEYQLCLCYLEGYGVDNDVPRGLKYLEQAAIHGCTKARRAARNFYSAFGYLFPPTLEYSEKEALLQLARLELENLHAPCIAAGALYSLDSAYFDQWIGSDDFRDARVAHFITRAAIAGVLTGETALDTESSALSEPAVGLSSLSPPVKGSAAMDLRGTGNWTSLHDAAARGDSRAVHCSPCLKDKVNAVTSHFGWTPLWVACEGGYFDVACDLLEHGADVTLRERTSGRSILHLLSRFREASQIQTLVAAAVASGLQVDDIDRDGNTPLLKTFVGWDFSCGAAARILLEEGANPLVTNRSGWNPLSVCVNRLNHDMLRAMLMCPSLDGVLEENVVEAMTDALRSIIAQPPSIQISLLGARREVVMKDLLRQLATDQTTRQFLLQPQSRGLSPLGAATWLGRESLALLLLEVRPKDLDRHDDGQRTALQLALSRNQSGLVKLYIKQGADPLITDLSGNNALHVAAESMPSMLVTVADALVVKQCNKQVLDNTNAGGYTPFGLAVLQGSAEHIHHAKQLRSKYQIDHDPWVEEMSTTLLGVIVSIGSLVNGSNYSQVEYLLAQRPRARFVTCKNGVTLLHQAVLGWKNSMLSLCREGEIIPPRQCC